MDVLGRPALSHRGAARLEEVSRNLRNGIPLVDALETRLALATPGYHLMRVGERSGGLPSMPSSLARLCDGYGLTAKAVLRLAGTVAAILRVGGAISVLLTITRTPCERFSRARCGPAAAGVDF